MELKVRFGHPVLIFIYTLSVFLMGDGVGIFWRTQPVITFSIALLSASFMVAHDTFMTLLWAWGAARWAQAVSDGVRKVAVPLSISSPGYHTLKIWMVDPAVVLERIVLYHGHLLLSYLGPPESFHASMPPASQSSANQAQ